VDTFFLLALEKSTGADQTARNAALLARTCGPVFPTDWSRKPPGPESLAEDPQTGIGEGTFHEVVHFPTGKVTCSASQLWTAVGFANVCMRAGLVEY